MSTAGPDESAQATAAQAADDNEELSYTLPMRIFGGITWGTMLSLAVGGFSLLIPKFPHFGPWAIPAVWVTFSGLGIALQWNVARGACPKCGTVQIVPGTGKRCPECRSYLKSVNREVVKY